MTLTLFAIIIAILLLQGVVQIVAARTLSRSTTIYARARFDGDRLICACHLSADDDTPPCRTGCQIVRVLADGRRRP